MRRLWAIAAFSAVAALVAAPFVNAHGVGGSFLGAPDGTIVPTASQWADSLNATTQTIASVAVVRPNCNGRLTVNVPAGTSSLVVNVASTLGVLAGFDGGIGVLLDGVYSTDLDPTGSSGITAYVVALDGLAHTVQLWSGYQNATGGTYVQSVRGTGISFATPVQANRELVWYGDSIAYGIAASPPAEFSALALVRGIFPGGVAEEAWGGRTLWDDSGSGSGQSGFASVSLLAARLVALCGSASTCTIWISIGTNDYNQSRWSAASFGTSMGALLDAVHTDAPTVPVFVQTPTTATVETANSFGATLGNIRTADASACSARSSFCTTVAGPSVMASSGLSADGLHPTIAGHQAIALGTGAAAGSTSMRAAMGF